MYYNLLIGGTLYTDIKSISCTPEYDPTCATLPICEFEAEFKTTAPASSFLDGSASIVTDFNGNNVKDSSDMPIVGGYNIEEVKQISADLVYIRARSWLSWLDKRVLAGEKFTSVNVQTFLYRLFRDTPVNDGAPVWIDDETDPPIRIYYNYRSRNVNGYCPEQTARERLQWLCQAWMMRATQWDNTSDAFMYIEPTVDHPDAVHLYRRILPKYTYSKPTVRHANPVGSVVINACSDFTWTVHEEDGWSSVVTGYDYELTEDGVIPIEIKLYFREYAHQTDSTITGDAVSVKGNTLLLESNTDVLNAMPSTFLRGYEVELECLQLYAYGSSWQCFFPGTLVEFYTDPQTMYKGVVKSASFTFGILAKAKLVISTDLVPVEMAHVIVRDVYSPSAGVERLLCVRHYWVPRSDNAFTAYNSQMREWVVNRLERFNPTSSQSHIAITGAEQTLTVTYNRL